MTKQNESAEVVKDRILKTATELFAKFGVSGVGIRRIAEEAGINHALIIRYFGSKENLVTEILHKEITALTESYPANPKQHPSIALENLQKMLLRTLTVEENTIRLIIRSELDGFAPEQYVSQQDERAANLIAKWIGSHQSDPSLPDPKLVSMLIIGAVFSLVAANPWLMTAVGLPPEEYEQRKPEIISTAVWLISRTIDTPPALLDDQTKGDLSGAPR